MVKVKTDINQQAEAVKYISATFEQYKKLMQDRMNDYLDIYKEYSTFKQQKKADWDTTFKVNKAYEVVNKVLPRIVGKNPKWLLSYRPDVLNEVNALDSDDAKQTKLQSLEMVSTAIGDYLTHVFKKNNLLEPVRLWAKNMMIYGTAFARVRYTYEIARSVVNDKEVEQVIDENGQVIEEKEVPVKKIKEKVWKQYPTIDPKSWTDLYYDPRYIFLKDMPGVIEYVNGIRLSQLKSNDKYFNLDKIEELVGITSFQDDPTGFKNAVFALCGVSLPESFEGVNKNALNLKIYSGLYEKDGEERLYEITIVNDILVIGFEEITSLPYVQIKCFEDSETNFATGFVEPIMGLQQELNFKKNATSTYINNALNRSWVWSPNSGTNPKDLISKPNGIIPTTKSVEDAMKNLQELPHRDVNPSYFQEQNDFERQIQSLTFTVDTSNPQNQQSLTNTATGARIKFFESNSVLEEVKRHFEDGLVQLAYKILEITYENLDENLIIEKQGDKGFREINKEAIKDAITKFEINVEANSSSRDSIETRREDAIAKYNIGLQSIGAGVPVNMNKMFNNVMRSFEDNENYLQNQGLPMGMPGVGGQLPQPQMQPNGAAQLTEQVAKGGITAGM